jgi:hypothetical protein
VEYHDPSGIFPLISQDIAARLPLRNLNWHSPPRPLRQIKSLHVEFVPDKSTENTLKLAASRTDSEGPQNSVEIVRSGVKAIKERRHQIPGFRTSPYLKIYLLRCDDKEAYKEHDRRRVREWIKENAQHEGKQHHDACEWLILHVVIPDTLAASEPRWRESSRDPDDLKERKGGSKLMGKSTRTVFDRLRADFNESGKTAVDHVAQIRLVRKASIADLLPAPAVISTYEETPQERENSWSDLISKFKSLILGPFDHRVRQYEADIAEQESRRSMPGWNFCTFFIHKEGLAKALESIGLVEDALAIYDELSLGLESVIRELAAGQLVGSATSFADYTDDIMQRITGTRSNVNCTSDETTKERNEAAALFDKDYRESIVRSNISVFDFMCYIFARQKGLILRLANAQSARLDLHTQEGGEDLVLTSEVCWRASTFIHVGARALRQDLSCGLKDSPGAQQMVENLVCSWTWVIAGQVLGDTAAPALLEITNHAYQDPKLLSNGNADRPSLSMGLGGNSHPQRTSSLPDAKAARDLTRPPDRRSHPRDESLRPSTSASAGSTKPGGLPGQAELATYRAELIMTRRRMLEQSARCRGWYAGWAFAKHARHTVLEDVNLQEVTGGGDGEGDDSTQHLCISLKHALATREAFQSMYESVTDAAIRHYHTATQSKTVESLLGDLAMLKYQQDDYLTAATYFEHVLPLYSDESWDAMEAETLSTYSYCLRQLQRENEYVQTLLKLLAKLGAQERERQMPQVLRKAAKPLQQGGVDAAGLLNETVEASKNLEQPITKPLKSYFREVWLDKVVTHHADDDSSSLILHLQHVLPDEIELDEAGVRLISVDDPTQEVWLTCPGVVVLRPGANQLELQARTVTYGPYLVDTILIRAKQLRFIEEVRSSPEPTPLGITVIEPTTTIRDSSKPPAFVFLYPAEHAFHAGIKRCSSIHIDKLRHLELTMISGRNKIEKLDLRLKPKTAGLRLHLGDAVLHDVHLDKQAQAQPGQLTLQAIEPWVESKIIIPYTLEAALKDIALRLEVCYTTAEGTFTFLLSKILAHELPIDVDVNDMFQLDRLFSSFNVKTVGRTPLRICDATLKDSPIYAVEAPPSLPTPLTIFDAEPMNLIYKITRKAADDKPILKRDAALALEVQYQPIDELLTGSLRESFLADFQQSNFSRYHRLLEPILLDRCRQHLTKADLEMVALLGEYRVPNFDAIGWYELIATLPESVQRPLQDWLLQWHMQHPTLQVDNPISAPPQTLILSVDVPNVDVVFSTSLDLPDVEPRVASCMPILVLGQPISAEICVRHTTCWSTKHIFPHVPTFKLHGDEGGSTSTFAIDVGTESDTWLVGGQRRRHFTPLDGAGAPAPTFRVSLIPLRLGVQPLPVVEVQQESPPDSDAGDHHSAAATAVSCETHFQSAGAMVRVVQDVRSARVQIPDPVDGGRPGS